MADQLVRCKPVSRNGETQLDIEALVARGSWRPVMAIRPDVRFTAKDTLNLDIFSSHAVWRESKASRKEVSVQGGDESARIATQVSVHSHDMLRVESRVSFRRAMRVEMARDLIALRDFPLDHSWAPHQTPLHEMVVGDFAFRAPAVVLQSKDLCLAVVPNLRVLASSRAMPMALTFNPAEKLVACGCVPHRLVHDTYFAHYDTDTMDVSGVVVYSYFICVQRRCAPREGVRRIAHRLWCLHGGEGRVAATAPRAASLDVYAAHAAQRDIPAAMREAFGLALCARRTRDESLLKRAFAIKDQTLALPQKDGLFAVRSPFGPENKDSLVRLSDLSWTCHWLLRWHREIDADDRILPFVRAYAARLEKLQKHGGHVPAWLDPATGKASRFCARSAESAAHVAFLAALHAHEPDMAALRCARRAVNFVIREIVPESRWENTEAFCTTAPQWKERKPLRKDPIQGSYTAHVTALWTVADALLRLFEATKRRRYLSWGERVLDELSLYQQLWDPPYVAVPCFGGFGATNADVHWNDAAQALIARTYLDYYRACGLTEYFQRGMAALRAAWSMLRCPENQALSALLPDAPDGMLVPSVTCVNPAHPRTQPGIIAASGVTELSLLCIGELIKRDYGDVYIDTRREQAFGVNGVEIERVQQDLAGFAVFGREALGHDRTLAIRTDTGQSFNVKVKSRAAFEVQA